MNTYHNNDTGLTIRVSYGKGVELPQDTDRVQVTYYAANNVVKIVKQSVYSGRLCECHDVEELACNLFADRKKQRKHKVIKQPNIDKKKKCKSTESKKNDVNYSDKLEINENHIAKCGHVIDLESGEIVSECRTNDSLRRSYNRQKDLIYNNCECDKSIFATFTIDSKPTYDALNKITAAFCKWLRRNFYSRLKCGFIFLEPCKDGSWHLHMIIAFADEVTETDDAQILKWWQKKNKKFCDEQVEIEHIDTFERLKKIVEYLNPNSKKKRDRVKHYPVSSQPIRHFGNVEPPNKVLTEEKIAKEIAGNELPAMRKKFEVVTDDNTLLFASSEYYYNIELSSLPELQVFEGFDNSETVNIIQQNDNIVKPFFEKKLQKGKCSFNDYIYDNYTSRYG